MGTFFKRLFVFIFGLSSILIALPVFGQCVPPDVAIKSWEENIERPMFGLTARTLECDPCKCPTGGMAACYEFMAEKEREKENRYKQAMVLIERAKKYGICK